MKKIEIEVPEGKKAEWVNGVLTLVDDKPANVMECIKTFSDACSELKKNHPFFMAYLSFEDKHQKDVVAYLKLRIIASALNEGWTPKFTKDEYRWYPWFRIEKDGGIVCTVADDALSVSSSYVGSRLAFKSEELAEYAGTQFIDIWKDYLINYEEED